MKYVLFMILLCSLYKIQICKDGSFNEDYISREQTTAINGIFVILVFLRHFATYVSIDPHSTFGIFNKTMNQQIVVTFLFYSGYGIMTSIKNKGSNYVKGLFLRRFVVLWAHFIIAVFLFHVYNIIMGIEFDTKTILLAYVGWNGIGNSFWYIFCMLLLYLFVILSFNVFKKDPDKALLLMLGLILVYMHVIKPIKDQVGESCWYTTVLMFWVGMLFARYKNQIDAAIWKNNERYFVLFIGILSILTIVWALLPLTRYDIVIYQMKNLYFMIFILLLTMKVKIQNHILSFFGKYTFEIFALQRLPLRFVARYTSNMYIILTAGFIVTVLLSVVFKFITKFLDKQWFKLLDRIKPQKA